MCLFKTRSLVTGDVGVRKDPTTETFDVDSVSERPTRRNPSVVCPQPCNTTKLNFTGSSGQSGLRSVVVRASQVAHRLYSFIRSAFSVVPRLCY